MIFVTDDEREIVKLSKESLLFNGERCWVKKSGASFDVTMGSLDGAETSEIIGVYLLGKIKKIIPQQQLGLYRDDGLAVINVILISQYGISPCRHACVIWNWTKHRSE